MDPLTALGVAAAVVQFVDFGTKLISKAREVYKSPSGQTLEVVKLSTISADLAQLGRNVQDQSARISQGRPVPGSSEELLLNICQGCAEANLELEKATASLRARRSDADNSFDFSGKVMVTAKSWRISEVDEHGRRASGRWAERSYRSFGTALAELKDFKAEGWKARLADLRNQMMTAMLAVLWETSTKTTLELEHLSRQQSDMLAILNRLDNNRRVLRQSVIQLASERDAQSSPDRRAVIDSVWSSAWIQSQAEKDTQAWMTYRTSSEAKHATMKDTSDEHAYVNAIRNSLRFQGSKSREEAIPDAHIATLQWIFTKPDTPANMGTVSSGFAQWLSCPSNDIYWITGKPGAGKSTLMKFIASHPTTRTQLLGWAGDRPLLTAAFYFWNAGNKLQKSQTGLLRTLLLQCLESMPHLVPQVCPRRWALFNLFGLKAYEAVPDWTWAELLESFSILQTFVGESFKLALFIDGLDEFDGAHEQLIDFVKLFHARPGVKICVSSRPENVFLDAFACSSSLRMEDFTSRDIFLFVNSRFDQTRGFLDLLQARPAEASRLIQGIVEKAQGVFLWVSVVVLALCEGLTEGDKLSDLQAVLDTLPSDLSALYTSIWAGIKAQYITHASQLFQIYNSANFALDAVILWLADDDGDVLSQDINKIDDGEREHIIKQMKRRLNSRTRGLLEVSQSGTVDYLHRSVRDWAATVWEDILSKAPDFDPHLALLKALTVEAPRNELWNDRRLGLPTEFWTRVCVCFFHAAKVRDDPSTVNFLVQVLDKLDEVLGTVSTSYSVHGTLALYRDFSVAGLMSSAGSKLPHWASTQSTKTPGRLDTTFIGLSAQFAVLPYVRTKVLANRELLRPSQQHLSILSCATLGFEHFSRPDIVDLSTRYSQSLNPTTRLQLVHFLLERGALSVPSRKQSGTSGWKRESDTCAVIIEKETMLKSIHDADPEELQYWRDVANLFADYYEKAELEFSTNNKGKVFSRMFKGFRGKKSG